MLASPSRSAQRCLADLIWRHVVFSARPAKKSFTPDYLSNFISKYNVGFPRVQAGFDSTASVVCVWHNALERATPRQVYHDLHVAFLF